MFGRKKKESDYFLGKVEEVLGEAACPVCRLTEKAIHGFIDDLFYSRITDPSERKAYVNGNGYCHRHFGMIEGHLRTHPELGTLGINILLLSIADIANTAADGDYVEFGKGCKMCDLESDTEKDYVRLFAQFVSKAERLGRYGESPSTVCFGHSKMISGLKDFDPAGFERVQKEKLHRLERAMEEFVRKSDYRNSGEPVERLEGTAWKIFGNLLK